MATATKPVIMVDDGVGTDRSRVWALGRRGLSSSSLASDVSYWNWATVGGIGRDDRAHNDAGQGGGKTARDLTKSLMRYAHPKKAERKMIRCYGRW